MNISKAIRILDPATAQEEAKKYAGDCQLYANAIWEATGLLCAEYKDVTSKLYAAVNDLNKIRKKYDICFACANNRFDYDKDKCFGCPYNNDNNWEWEGWYKNDEKL